MSWTSAVLDLLIPQVRCLNCNEPRQIDRGQPLCDACAAELRTLQLREGLCPHCLSPWPGRDPCRYCAEGGMLGLEASFAPYRYHGAAAGLVKALKYQGVYLAAEPLIQAMLDSLDGRPFDAMVPVPLHRSRQRQRGFNQAALLCEGLSPALKVPVLSALRRDRATKAQSALAHHRRAANVEDAFSAILPVEGLQLLLVDDIRTTGATGRNSARELLAAGARSVCLLTATVAAPQSSSVEVTADTARLASS